jgi:hypothetical protein
MLEGVLLLGLWYAIVIRCGGLVDCGAVCGGGVGVWSGAVPGVVLGGGVFGCSLMGAL